MTWNRLHWNAWVGRQASLTKLFSWTLLLMMYLSVDRMVSSQPEPPTPPSPSEGKAIEIRHEIDLAKGNAILSCIVKDLGRRRIIWKRLSDPYPISVGTLRFHPDRKYRVANQANTNILTIQGIGLEDAGEYQCRVSGAFALTETVALIMESDKANTYFRPSNRSITAAVGMTVTLPCEVENLNTKMVMWKDDRQNLITLRKRVYNGDNRFKVIHNIRREWNLQIENLVEEDFGFYTCVVNAKPVLTRTIELINEEPPKFAPVIMKDTNYRKKIEVMEGETVTMTCNFHAYPPATVRWYKRYKEGEKTKKTDLGAVGNEYTLQSVKTSQSGDYICIGKNGMKETGKARTRLTVKALPTTVPTTMATTVFVPTGPSSPYVYHKGQRIGSRRGRNAEISCFAVGQPRPTIHWLRHGKRLFNDHKYKLTTKSVGRYNLHSTLLVRSVSSRDFGNYRCDGHNQYGNKFLDIELYETTS